MGFAGACMENLKMISGLPFKINMYEDEDLCYHSPDDLETTMQPDMHVFID
jgi:hypothetical protein